MSIERSSGRKLSRREVLKSLGIAMGALLLTRSTRAEKLKPRTPKSSLVALDPLIYSYPTKESSETEVWKISVNPKGFYDALEYTAWREERGKGLAKLELFLKQNQIPVEFVDTLPGRRAAYTPTYWIFKPKGPRLSYLSSVVGQKYVDTERTGNVSGRRVHDWDFGYHEIFHIWQEVRNPLTSALASTIDLPALSKIHPFEIEATNKSWEIMMERNQLRRLDRFFLVTRIH